MKQAQLENKEYQNQQLQKKIEAEIQKELETREFTFMELSDDSDALDNFNKVLAVHFSKLNPAQYGADRLEIMKIALIDGVGESLSMSLSATLLNAVSAEPLDSSSLESEQFYSLHEFLMHNTSRWNKQYEDLRGRIEAVQTKIIQTSNLKIVKP